MACAQSIDVACRSSSQTIEDLKQNLTELNEKFNSRHNVIDQLTSDNSKLKQKLEQADIRLRQYQVNSLLGQE